MAQPERDGGIGKRKHQNKTGDDHGHERHDRRGRQRAAARENRSATGSPRGANSSDLDAWLEKVEALGELKRITAEVDPDLEAATITYLVGGEKSPALLFENIKGHPGHQARSTT